MFWVPWTARVDRIAIDPVLHVRGIGMMLSADMAMQSNTK